MVNRLATVDGGTEGDLPVTFGLYFGSYPKEKERVATYARVSTVG